MSRNNAKTQTAPEEQKSKYAAYRKEEDKSQKPQNFKGTLRRLIEMLAKYKVAVITVFIVASAATILNVFTPDIMGDIIDAFTKQLNNRLDGLEMDFTETIQLILKIFYFYFGFTLCEFVQTYLMAGVSQKLVCDIRERVNVKLSHLPLRYFDRSTKGEIISKIVNDCDNLSSTLQSNITTVVTSALQVIGVAIMMFRSSWQLALISMILVPVSGFFARVISKRSKILFRKFWDRTGDLNGHIEEMYTGHNIVRIFNHRKKATEEFDEITDSLMDISVKANFVSGLLKPILSIFWNLTYVLICFTGAMLVLNMPGGRTGGTLQGNIGFVVAFIQYAGMFSSPINNIASIVNTIQSCLASAERVFSLVDEKDETEIDKGKTLDDPQGVVEFKDVCFSYSPDKPLIENLNLTANKGQLVAVVGPTGAGKTTLVNLLMRFYEITSGDILVDGVSIKDMSRQELREIFGMILQETWVINGTLRENIVYNLQNVDENRLQEILEETNLSHYVATLPQGLETEIQKESALSAGQKQLVTIARAMTENAPMLILDEATSNVDTRTEILIQKAMDSLTSGRTSFVIAHRLSTIKNADLIFVMKDGNIVETGNHDSLMELGGLYSEIYNSQFN